MEGYTDYQNYLLNKIAYINFGENIAPGEPLSACIPDKYKSLREELEAAGLGHLVLKDYANNNLAAKDDNGAKDEGSRSGFCAVAVEDPETGAVAISYRGTENLDKVGKEEQMDMVDNIYAAVLGTSEQKNEAIAFFEKNKSKEGKNYLYGHSKGGELASEVYAEYHDEIQGMHIYNPQPINNLKLDKEQKEAFKSDKVHVVIIDGDFVTRLGDISVFGDRITYMKCNGKEDGLGYPHQLVSASFQDGKIVVEPNPYAKYPRQKIIGDIAEFIVTKAQKWEMPMITLNVLITIKLYEFIKQDLPNMVEKLEQAVDRFLDMLDAAKEKINELKKEIKEFISKLKQEFTTWLKETFDAGYRYACENTLIELDTAKLRGYADRLVKVNERIKKLDKRIDKLYKKVGLQGLAELMSADLLTGYSGRVSQCVTYLNDTAADFEAVERTLVEQLG